MRRPVLLAAGVVLGGLALVLLVAAVAVFTLDPATLAGPVLERVKAATGRDLQIAGGLDLKLSLTPRLELRDVALANAPWGTAPSLVSAKRLDIELALLPLLKRQLDIRHIELVGPTIALETDAGGHGNWELGRPDRTPAAGPASGAQGLGSTLIGIGSVEVADGTVTYRNGRTGAIVQVMIEKLALQARDLGAPVNAQFRGVVEGVPMALTGNAGPLQGFLERGEPVPVDLDGEIATRKVKVEGKLAADNGATSMSDLRARVGDTDLRGSVERGSVDGRTRLVLRLASSRLALADLALAAAVSPPAQGATPTKGAAPAKGATPQTGATPAKSATPAKGAAVAGGRYVLPDTPLPLGMLRDDEVDVDLRAATLLTADGRPLTDVHLALTARDGRVDAPEVALAAYGGHLRAALHGDVRASPPRMHIDVAGDDLDLGQVVASSGHPGRVTGGKTELRATVDTRGDTLHAWGAAANGTVAITIGPAALGPGRQAGAVPLLELLTAVLPSAGVGDITELRCAVIRLPLAGGIARVQRSIGLETNRIGLVASGTIDLRDEAVDLVLRPVAAGGGPLDVVQLIGAVRWRGPWRDAHFSLDPVAAVAGSPENMLRLGSALLGQSGLGNLLRGGVVPQAANEPGACTVARGARVP